VIFSSFFLEPLKSLTTLLMAPFRGIFYTFFMQKAIHKHLSLWWAAALAASVAAAVLP
jgi:mannose/cellobiose epimerase-like protein (N-acyl-D-glucosamine 2-epimerase family)